MRMSLSCILTRMNKLPDLKQIIVNAHKDDVKLQEIVQLVSTGDKTNYAIYENGSFWYGGRGIVPSSLQFRKNFEDEIYFKGGRIVTPRNIP